MKYAIYCGYPIKITNWDLTGIDFSKNYEKIKEIDAKKELIFWNLISFIYEVPEKMKQNTNLEDFAYGSTDPDFFQEITQEEYELAIKLDL